MAAAIPECAQGEDVFVILMPDTMHTLIWIFITPHVAAALSAIAVKVSSPTDQRSDQVFA